MKYYIIFNGKYITSRKSLESASKEVVKRGYTNTNEDVCYIKDEFGELYTTTGEYIEDFDEWMNSLNDR